MYIVLPKGWGWKSILTENANYIINFIRLKHVQNKGYSAIDDSRVHTQVYTRTHSKSVQTGHATQLRDSKCWVGK